MLVGIISLQDRNRRQGDNTVKNENVEKKKIKPKYDPPKRSALEEVGNSVTHGVGALLSVAAMVLMYVSADGSVEYVGATVYGVGLFIMFTMSCLYHAFPHGSAVKRLFRRFDYSCIYVLIGATFAPILIAYIGGVSGYSYLIAQWCVIIFGVTLVSVFSPARFRGIHISLYLILGWGGLMLLPEMLRRGDVDFLFWILGGGVVYSVGIIPFAMHKRASHFIWHFFVLFGAIVQWFGVYIQIYLA